MKSAVHDPDLRTADIQAATRTLPALHATNVALALAAGGVGCAILGWESKHLFWSCFAAALSCSLMAILLGMQLRVKEIVEHRPVTIGRVMVALVAFVILSVQGWDGLRDFFQPIFKGLSVSPSQFRSGAHGFCGICLGVLVAGILLGLSRDEAETVKTAADSSASLNRGV